MYQQFVLAALLAVSLVSGNHRGSRPAASCAEIFCGVGRECVEDGKDAQCECIEACNVPIEKVCGSDGQTYDSECHMHKTACMTNRQIELVSNTNCQIEEEAISKALVEEKKMKSDVPSPVVCLEKDRDSIRSGLISFLSREVDGEVEAKRSYKSLLLDYFKLLDEDKDGSLNSMEMMKLLEKNETISEVVSMETQTSNPLLRGLCIDALILTNDKNSDYKLELTEFQQCLDPAFTPPKSRCESDGHEFADGQELIVDCNSCKCACGNFVCTNLECGGDKNIDTKLDSLSDNLYGGDIVSAR